MLQQTFPAERTVLMKHVPVSHVIGISLSVLQTQELEYAGCHPVLTHRYVCDVTLLTVKYRTYMPHYGTAGIIDISAVKCAQLLKGVEFLDIIRSISVDRHPGKFINVSDIQVLPVTGLGFRLFILRKHYLTELLRKVTAEEDVTDHVP